MTGREKRSVYKSMMNGQNRSVQAGFMREVEKLAGELDIDRAKRARRRRCKVVKRCKMPAVSVFDGLFRENCYAR